VIGEKIITQLSICPTCSKEVSGNYCSNCGERILADKQELRLSHFLKEAYHELFDLDSKFVRTLRYLFTRPGFLTLEILHGRKSIYIKPIRLYIMLVLLHFLSFSMIQSADIFNVDRLPLMNFAPQLKEIIQEKEVISQQTHEEFTLQLSQKIKDNLSIILYFVVFLAAGILHLLYPSFRRYYVEHLYFVFHVFSFGFARNMLVIPLILLDLIPLTVVLVIGTQLIYAFVALKKVYPQANIATVLKMVVLFASIVPMIYVSLHVATFIALAQMGLGGV
jgi:hypothetical protein